MNIKLAIVIIQNNGESYFFQRTCEPGLFNTFILMMLRQLIYESWLQIAFVSFNISIKVLDEHKVNSFNSFFRIKWCKSFADEIYIEIPLKSILNHATFFEKNEFTSMRRKNPWLPRFHFCLVFGNVFHLVRG